MYAQRIYAGSITRTQPSSSVWLAPPNTDASLSEEGVVGLSVVARNNEGKVLFSVVWRMRARWPSNIAEAKAIYLAICWAKKQGLKEIIIESDSQVIVSRLS